MNDQEQVFSLANLEWHSILRDIRRYAWMIVMAMVTAAMGAYVALHLIIQPTFTSSATIVVTAKTNSDSAYSDLRMSSAMTSVFTQVLGSDLLQEKVAEDMGVLEFPGKLKVEVIPETNLLEISTTAHSPQGAFDLMQSVIKVYPTISDYIYSNAMLDVISHPTMPEEATNFIEDSIVVELSILGGLLLMTMLIALMSFLKDTVKTETAFHNKVDAKLMAVIHHENKYVSVRSFLGKKNKSSILLNNPLVSFSFVETFHKICTKIEYASVNQGCRSILVTGVTENEGKSTVASNIALSLAQKGFAVALIDADFRKPAQFKIFEKEVPPDQEIGICLLGGCRDVRRIAYYDEKTGIYMIFGTKKYSNSAEMSASESMAKLLEQCKEFADFIILDTPPMMLVADTEGLNDLVDASILVVRQDVPYTSDINDAVDVLRQSKGTFLGCIFNDVPVTSVMPVTSYGHYDHYGKYGRYGYGQYGKYDRKSSAATEKGVETANALGGNTHSQHSTKRAVASNVFNQTSGYRDWDDKMRESIAAEEKKTSRSRSDSQERPEPSRASRNNSGDRAVKSSSRTSPKLPVSTDAETEHTAPGGGVDWTEYMVNANGSRSSSRSEGEPAARKASARGSASRREADIPDYRGQRQTDENRYGTTRAESAKPETGGEETSANPFDQRFFSSTSWGMPSSVAAKTPSADAGSKTQGRPSLLAQMQAQAAEPPSQGSPSSQPPQPPQPLARETLTTSSSGRPSVTSSESTWTPKNPPIYYTPEAAARRAAAVGGAQQSTAQGTPQSGGQRGASAADLELDLSMLGSRKNARRSDNTGNDREGR